MERIRRIWRNFSQTAFDGLAIPGIVRHGRYDDLSLPLRCVRSDTDFQNLSQLLMRALNHADGLRVFQSGVARFDSGCL